MSEAPEPNFARRFWDRVTIDPAGCWTWSAPSNRDGYGRVGRHGKQSLAHRVAYELIVGQIPEGMQLDHLCHTWDTECHGGACKHRSCVNPNHLEPVTPAENKARGRAGQHASNGETCLRGHGNWQVSESGRRTCRTCRDERVARWSRDNAEHRAAYAERNREARRAYNREYHAKNRQQRLEYMAARRAERKES